MYKCEKCEKELKTKGAKTIHQRYCNGEGSKLDLKKEKEKEVCPKCGMRILASKEKHYNYCNGLGPRRLQPKKGYNPWNKGMSKETNEKIKEMSDNMKKDFKSGKRKHPWKGRKHKKETIKKLEKRTNFGIVNRSKNEVYFFELCKNEFDNVLNNEKIFDGWDADVILTDYKIAILWNGKWHYEKITKEHSLLQVQNRDKIKLKKIKENGYKPYIIKDMGKYNKDFVEEKFYIFLKWFQKNIINQ